MVAALGETTAGPALPRLRDIMLESAEGRRILKERPRVTSSTIDMNALAKLPEGTFGHTYVTWLERCGVTPDTREPVGAIPSIIYPLCCFSYTFLSCLLIIRILMIVAWYRCRIGTLHLRP